MTDIKNLPPRESMGSWWPGPHGPCDVENPHGHPPYSALAIGDRCYLCNRRETDVNVTLDGAVQGVCSTCWERGVDEIRIPLDYTEDEGDD